MRLRNKSFAFVVLATFVSVCQGGVFAIVGAEPGSWPAILSAVGHIAGSASEADIFVARPGTPASADWKHKVESGSTLILEGSSPLAISFGFKGTRDVVPVVHLVDTHAPDVAVIWEKDQEIPRFEIPEGARVFAKERWTGAPVIAGMRLGTGAVLWVATAPGPEGYERYPYLMQALTDVGTEPMFRTSRLWVFFDYSYRLRADPEYLARRWRAAGIAALHVAAWHFYDPDPERDAYLRSLIEACHRHAILIYAWVELPHVSDRFWADHPEWREKTAVLQDAQLDWRKLMNLQNPYCAAAVRTGLTQMMDRFDWDGLNLAELYFESLEGASNPARFTPMNDDVRAAFRSEYGWDPVELWWKAHNDSGSLRRFLDYRAALARRMQQEWLETAESFRSVRPDLDIVLTHVDDRFDAGMKDSIGADAAAALPLLETHPFRFLIEDPATVWNLGPKRYPEIAKRYQPLTRHTDKLAIDINVVERYQDVYPTKQQTGTELFELVHSASAAFPQTALYFESSILKPDLALLPSSAAIVTRFLREKQRITVESSTGVEVKWSGPALVDGKAWPLQSPEAVRLPRGGHTIEPAAAAPVLRIVDLNAELLSASASGKTIRFQYASDSRAYALFDHAPGRLELDAVALPVNCLAAPDCVISLPRGLHTITATAR